MENKYFTPDIEDIRVGYECEIWWCCGEPREWVKTIATLEDEEEYAKLTVSDIALRIGHGDVRVPYLTKEQIEAEGWENIAVYRDGGTTIFLIKNSKCSYELTFRGRAHLTPSDKITITEIRETPDRPVRVNIFTGECKDINTFKKIIKLLGI
jgi:hypothetical protein